VQWLQAPDGRFLSPTDFTVTEKGTSLTISGDCDMSGTWVLRLRPKSGSAGGDYGYAMKVAQPKGVVYKVD
jgi:hypothetical protein